MDMGQGGTFLPSCGPHTVFILKVVIGLNMARNEFPSHNPALMQHHFGVGTFAGDYRPLEYELSYRFHTGYRMEQNI